MAVNKDKEHPLSVGIIMDGNRRWAKQNALPSLEGHRRGYEKLKEVLHWCRARKVGSVIVYAFSTENWNRAQEEVSYLMDLFRRVVNEMTEEAIKNDTRICFLGERSRLPQDIVESIVRAEDRTSNANSFLFGIALSYGGRAEIIDAIRRIPPEKIGTLTEDEFSALLWTREFPDPDLIIRTSGEERLSGFLTWQSVYSELFFTGTLWPDFGEEEFDLILERYAARSRRRGC